MSVMKYFFSIMGVLCLWLFGAIVIDFNKLLDVPMFVYVIMLAALISGAHLVATSRYGNPGPEDFKTTLFIKLFVLGVSSLVVTIVAALGLSAAINPEYRAELSAPFVTCKRDDTQIETVSVNKEIRLDSGTITIHSITNNVPQSSENPQPYAYACQKATLADVTITSDAKSDVALEIRDLELVTSSKPNGITAAELNSSSQYTAYAKSQKHDVLRQIRLNDSRSGRGWVAFPTNETDNTDLKSFRFDKYGQNKTVDLN